jgi:hypothetical protein
MEYWSVGVLRQFGIAPRVRGVGSAHKELNRFAPLPNPAEKAPFAGLKEAGGLLPRPWSTRTKPSRLGLAQGGGFVRRGWLSVFSTSPRPKVVAAGPKVVAACPKVE